MALIAGESANELLQAQAYVWSHIFNYIDSMCLKSAVELGIFDIIHNHGKPMTLSELVAEAGVQPTKANCIRRLMRVLINSDFICVKKNVDNYEKEEKEEEEEDKYLLTSASRLLLKDEPIRAWPILLLNLDPISITTWQFLSSWVKSSDDAGATPFDMAHGRSYYEYMDHDQSFHNLFNEAMVTDSQLVLNLMLGECKWIFEGLKSLVDVGGGTGTSSKVIANAFPNMKCTVLDLPHVVADLHGTENLHFVGGDMFEAIPPANAILLKWILHNYNDEDSIKILKRCKEVIPTKNEGGKVIIIDMVIKNQEVDQQLPKAQLYFDMLMMVYFNGIERAEKEWKKLFLAAGFSHYKITPKLGLRSFIELYS